VKGSISPGVAVAIIIVVLVVVAIFGYKTLGPRTDGPNHPINMGAMMKASASTQAKTPYHTKP